MRQGSCVCSTGWRRLTDSQTRDGVVPQFLDCLLYTSDAADERSSVDLGGRRIIKKKKKKEKWMESVIREKDNSRCYMSGKAERRLDHLDTERRKESTDNVCT